MFFIKQLCNFIVFSNNILTAADTTQIRKTHDNNIETEAEAKAEAWASRVHGGKK